MTINQAEEYFKNATVIRCLQNNEDYNVTNKGSYNFYRFNNCIWLDIGRENVLLYRENTKKIAEIIKQKNK
jgi:hypothetical protein